MNFYDLITLFRKNLDREVWISIPAHTHPSAELDLLDGYGHRELDWQPDVEVLDDE